MPRIRTIKPEFFDDSTVGELSPWARLMFIGLWTQADREGRVVADWKRLRARLFPYDPKCPELPRLVVELHGKDMVRPYTDSQGRECLWIVKFLTHQRPHPKEPASVIEPWPGMQNTEQISEAVKRNGEPCKDISGRVDYGLLTMDHGSGNGNGLLTMDQGAKSAVADADGFAEFWQSYPKKQGKGAALKAWKAIRPSSELRATIAAAIEAQRTCRQWLKDGGQYIPNPATWLNQQRWGDEPDPDGPVLGGVTAHNMAVTDAWLKGHTS